MLMNMKADPEEEEEEKSIEDPILFIGLPSITESPVKVIKKLADKNEKDLKGPLH